MGDAGTGQVDRLMPLMLCGCGGRSATPIFKIVRPGRAIWCPTKLTLRTSPSEPNRPASGSFDTRSLLGQTVAHAAADARPHGCSLRVVKRDGRDLTITSDARANRVDAVVSHGIVTATGNST
jgi:hypothetical protein